MYQSEKFPGVSRPRFFRSRIRRAADGPFFALGVA